jgi:hypothetical protein
MSDKENPYDSFVTVFTEENQLKVNAENERGWSSYIVGDFDKDIKFKVNPAFLYEIMDKVGTITLGTNKALFETDNFKHVMALPE